jgi:serine phosphatase RsbU (regulator of sigma subunit)
VSTAEPLVGEPEPGAEHAMRQPGTTFAPGPLRRGEPEDLSGPPRPGLREAAKKKPANPGSIGPAGDDPIASLDQMRRLQRVTDAALAHLMVDDLLDELLLQVRDALSADTVAVLLLDEKRAELVARAAKGLEEEVREGVRIPCGRGFAGTIAATGRPMAIFDVDHSIVMNPIIKRKGVRSLLGVPLVVWGRTIGVLHVGTLRPRRFTQEDEVFLQLVGDRVALALHAALYERQRAVARTLQRSFLPERLPVVPGLELAARYRPARCGDVGGDWYDVFTHPGETVTLVIGDVVGRGINAATMMARIRNALRAYALESPSPSDVLARLNRLVLHFESNVIVTLLVGMVDPTEMTFRYASAGHLPPIFRTPDGSTFQGAKASGPPLGAEWDRGYVNVEEALGPGTTVVLCTDGLIERREESLETGLDRLCCVTSTDERLEEMADVIIQRLMPEAEHDDDVALLLARAVIGRPQSPTATPCEGFAGRGFSEGVPVMATTEVQHG